MTIPADEATARRIFDLMGIAGLDFSECTKAEFRRAALSAKAELSVPAGGNE